jgi:hypothetical protein
MESCGESWHLLQQVPATLAIFFTFFTPWTPIGPNKISSSLHVAPSRLATGVSFLRASIHIQKGHQHEQQTQYPPKQFILSPKLTLVIQLVLQDSGTLSTGVGANYILCFFVLLRNPTFW